MTGSKRDLAKKIQQLFGGKAEVWPEQEEIDQDTPIVQPNRRDKRRAKQRSAGGSGAVHDVMRLGSRPGRARRTTGQPLWFRQMKYDDQRRKALEKVTMDRLEPAVGRIALDLYHAGYENVWSVTQIKSAKEFLQHGQHDNQDIAIQGRDLQKLRNYLIQQRVPVKWEV